MRAQKRSSIRHQLLCDTKCFVCSTQCLHITTLCHGKFRKNTQIFLNTYYSNRLYLQSYYFEILNFINMFQWKRKRKIEEWKKKVDCYIFTFHKTLRVFAPAYFGSYMTYRAIVYAESESYWQRNLMQLNITLYHLIFLSGIRMKTYFSNAINKTIYCEAIVFSTFPR